MDTKLKQLLRSRLEYTDREAELVSADLMKLDCLLLPLLERWESDGIESDHQEYYGYSMDRLRREFHMNFIAALLTLDWIVKEPEKAIPILESGIK